jgi:hypothetical protein
MYKASQGQPGAQPGGAPPPPSDGDKPKEDVVDAEFVDVDDKK